MANDDKIMMQTYGTVVEPLGLNVRQTIKPAIKLGDKFENEHPIIHAILRSLITDTEEQSTMVEPVVDTYWRGRPVIYLPASQPAAKERKSGLSSFRVNDIEEGSVSTLGDLYKFIEQNGLKIVEKPYEWLKQAFGNYIGYRDSLLKHSERDTIYVANHLSPLEKMATAIHELFEDPYKPHEECQSKALDFAKKVNPKAYEVLWKMGRAVNLN